jgi:hypothetical protein
MSEEFRRRADECRRQAAAAGNASDKAFWLGLMERWQTLESRAGLVRRKPKHRELPPEPATLSAKPLCAVMERSG